METEEKFGLIGVGVGIGIGVGFSGSFSVFDRALVCNFAGGQKPIPTPTPMGGLPKSVIGFPDFPA